MTTAPELARRLGIDPKRLRAWLREEFPRGTGDHGSTWVITDEIVAKARIRFGGSGGGLASPEATGKLPSIPVVVSSEHRKQGVRPQPPSQEEVERAVRALTSPSIAISAKIFDRGNVSYGSAGLYSWWADDVARATLSEAWGTSIAELIYAGQTGATFWPSGKPSTATLASRLGKQHIGGNIYGSTFRLTLAATLMPVLGLRVIGPKRLEPSDNAALTGWIRSHLSVIPYPFADRDSLDELETMVIHQLDPPLNIDKMPPSELRSRLSGVRSKISRGAQP